MHDDETETIAPLPSRLQRSLRYHLGIFVVGVATFGLADFFMTGMQWAFWPIFFWSLALAFHYFLAKSLNVDDGWAESRAMRLRYKAYDIDHIRRIERSYQAGEMPGQHDLDQGPGEAPPPAPKDE